jgi:hypothetical protein
MVKTSICADCIVDAYEPIGNCLYCCKDTSEVQEEECPTMLDIIDDKGLKYV